MSDGHKPGILTSPPPPKSSRRWEDMLESETASEVTWDQTLAGFELAQVGHMGQGTIC